MSPSPRTPDRRPAAGLMGLNIALVAVLGLVVLGPLASGQQPGARKRGEYTMVGGAVQGGNSNAIFVLDAANQELIALRWDEGSKQLQGLDYRDLDRDARGGEAAPGDPGR